MYNTTQISVVGDDLQAIANEVCVYSSTYDFVLTSGGIGPTHDDITMEGMQTLLCIAVNIACSSQVLYCNYYNNYYNL